MQEIGAEVEAQWNFRVAVCPGKLIRFLLPFKVVWASKLREL